MSYHVVTRWGSGEEAPNEQRMRKILAELDEHDQEHPDACLTHETGWSLSVYESGLVIWENIDSEEVPRHQIDVSREKALELWLNLSRGEIAAIEREPWRPGQSPPRSPEEQARLTREAEASTMASFRRFHDQLGPERTSVSCRHPDCNRGAIAYGVFCRVHHFEMIYHQPCPFRD